MPWWDRRALTASTGATPFCLMSVWDPSGMEHNMHGRRWLVWRALGMGSLCQHAKLPFPSPTFSFHAGLTHYSHPTPLPCQPSTSGKRQKKKAGCHAARSITPYPWDICSPPYVSPVSLNMRGGTPLSGMQALCFLCLPPTTFRTMPAYLLLLHLPAKTCAPWLMTLNAHRLMTAFHSNSSVRQAQEVHGMTFSPSSST